MTTLDNIMALADEYALSARHYGFKSASAAKQSIALRAAIEQAEKQEPVVWAMETDECLLPGDALSWVKTHLHTLPLYTAPPAAQRQWVGLTEEERDAIVLGNQQRWEIAHNIEAKLREKNGGNHV
jgi:hypothetical protein